MVDEVELTYDDVLSALDDIVRSKAYVMVSVVPRAGAHLAQLNGEMRRIDPAADFRERYARDSGGEEDLAMYGVGHAHFVISRGLLESVDVMSQDLLKHARGAFWRSFKLVVDGVELHITAMAKEG